MVGIKATPETMAYIAAMNRREAAVEAYNDLYRLLDFEEPLTAAHLNSPNVGGIEWIRAIVAERIAADDAQRPAYEAAVVVETDPVLRGSMLPPLGDLDDNRRWIAKFLARCEAAAGGIDAT